MLSNSSICSTCDKKRVCKHFEYANKNTDLTINIESCESNAPMLTSTTKITPNTISTPATPWQPYDLNRVTSIPNKVYRTSDYPDLNKITSVYKTTGKETLKVTPVEQLPNGTCSICGKKTIVDNCSDCGEPVCSECGYTNLNVENNKPIITCDKCFGNTETKDSINTDWDISNFSEINEKEEKEDVKSNKKAGSQRSSKNTKKQ